MPADNKTKNLQNYQNYVQNIQELKLKKLNILVNLRKKLDERSLEKLRNKIKEEQ